MSNKKAPFEEKLTDAERKLWDASQNLSLPESPDAHAAWMRLERGLDAAHRPVPVRPSRVWWPIHTVQPKPVLALALAVLLIASPFVYTWMTTESIVAGRGEIMAHTLPEGSEIHLNAETAISYRTSFGEKSREIELKGEAFFDVEKGTIPFIVRAEDASVTALGTQFNVRSRDRWMEVVVNEGVVRVSNSVQDEERAVTLEAGQMTRFREDDAPALPRDVPFQSYPGWRENKLIFFQNDLMTVCREIGRRFDVEVRLASDRLVAITVTGVIEAEDVETALSTLALLTEKRYRFQDGAYIIY